MFDTCGVDLLSRFNKFSTHPPPHFLLLKVFSSVVLGNILYITGGSEVTTFPMTLSQWTLGFLFGYLPVHIGFWCGVEDDFPSILDVGMVYC